ncbi:hypothetical protein S40293_11573 [Stachybotrys chartarum IBT 40293]|nr:hypothetical protein S40293_11573 [Stachybotrys chartarum IBT 40293]
MHCVPSFLQPYIAWLLPAKWRVNRDWKELASFVVPEFLRQKGESRDKSDKAALNPDLVTWMVRDGRNELERDPSVLTTLCGSVAAGSTYSIAKVVCRALSYVVAHRDVLEAVHAEIHVWHTAIEGRWEMAAVARLDCLESAMKKMAC